MKAYQRPVSEIISLQLKDGLLDNLGEPKGSYDVNGLVRDRNIEEIGGDYNPNNANVFSKSLWEE